MVYGSVHGPVVERTDDQDFDAFVDARWAPLYRFAWLLTGGRESAEDLLQLALESCYVGWGGSGDWTPLRRT